MFPLPTHQRRRSFSGRPVSSYAPPSSLQAKVEEEPDSEQPEPRRAAARRFPVPLKWDAYWDSYRDIRLADRQGRPAVAVSAVIGFLLSVGFCGVEMARFGCIRPGSLDLLCFVCMVEDILG